MFGLEYIFEDTFKPLKYISPSFMNMDIKKLRKISTNVILVHAELDNVCKYNRTLEIYENLHNTKSKSLLIYRNAGHFLKLTNILIFVKNRQ
jgi:esterase/lipase